MFKFFRQFNKVILIIGGCVLMVAFLVPQAVTMFAPGGGDVELGTIHGREVTGNEVRSASFELAVLQNLGFGPGLPTLADGRPIDDGLTWLMLLADAREMGVWAGDAELNAALAARGLDDAILAEQARLRQVTPDFLRQAVRHWLIAEQYRELVAGIAYNNYGSGGMSPAVQRLEIYNQFARESEQFRDNPQMMQYFSQLAMLEMQGSHRLSRSLLTHVIRDNAATIRGRLLLIPADPDDATEPADDTLRELFNRYNDVLPGGGAAGSGTSGGTSGERPYPFGYRIPDRVQVEYLQLTREALQSAVHVGYADVLDYYRQNKGTFKSDAAEAPDAPTDVVRQQIEDQLVSREIERLRARVLDEVRSILAEDLRGLSEQDGYTQLPADFRPTPLPTVADRVQERLNVQLNVMGEPNRWLPLSELGDLPGIGFSALGGARGVFFPQYAGLAKSLVPDPQQVPRTLRLQVGTPSEPLQDFDGNSYLFRLTAAEPAHPPASLEAVRDQVVRDARTVAAYDALIQTADAWRQRVIENGLDAAAGSVDAPVQDVPPFQREAGLAGGVPDVPGVGRSKPFVDAAFALVDGLPFDTDVASLPVDQRLAVVPVPGRTALAVFLLGGYTPLTQEGYRRQLAGGSALAVSAALDRPAANPGSGDTAEADAITDPLSRPALARRTGFDLAAYDQEHGDDDVP